MGKPDSSYDAIENSDVPSNKGMELAALRAAAHPDTLRP